jgi:GPH family glycoside/pentoside/hexuronide:cation symporter
MFAGAILAGISVYLFFNPPDFSSTSDTVIYISIVIIFYFSAYTIFNVTYLAMPAEMTTIPDERTSLMIWRVFFVSMAGFVGLAFAPFLIWLGGENKESYGFMGSTLAITLSCAMLYCVFSTRNAPFTTAKTHNNPIKDQIRTAFENKPFIYITTAKFLQLLGLSTVTAALPFLAIYVIEGNYSLLVVYGVCLNISSIIFIPLWRRASRFVEKKHLYILAVIGTAFASFSWIVSGPNELAPLHTFTLGEYELAIPNLIYSFRCAAIGAFTAGVLLIGQSMVPDAIAYDYERTGLRREGMFSSVYSFVEKFAFSLGPLITGALLDFYGFIASSEGAVEQPDSAINAIFLCAAIVPAVAWLSSVPFLLKYKLGNSKYKIN